MNFGGTRTRCVSKFSDTYFLIKVTENLDKLGHMNGASYLMTLFFLIYYLLRRKCDKVSNGNPSDDWYGPGWYRFTGKEVQMEYLLESPNFSHRQ